MLKERLKVGDRIRWDNSSYKCTIRNVNCLRDGVQYLVEWDGDNGRYLYDHSMVKDLWTKIEPEENSADKFWDSIPDLLADQLGIDRRPATEADIQINRNISIEGCPVQFTNLIKKKLNECQHTWADYTGFTESYRYCTKCDRKLNHE